MNQPKARDYSHIDDGYIWAYRPDACREKLSDPEAIQECYDYVYTKMMDEYYSDKMLVEWVESKDAEPCENMNEGLMKDECLAVTNFKFCEKLDEGWRKDTCLDFAKINNVST